MYQYNAKVVSVYDGDTLRADIDLGFSTWVRGVDIRLHGINAPEMHGDTKVAGTKARDALRELVLGKEVVIDTFKDKVEKYGRYLAKVTCAGVCANQLLVDQGLAVPFMLNSTRSPYTKG